MLALISYALIIFGWTIMKKLFTLFLFLNLLILSAFAGFVDDRPPFFTWDQEKYLAEHPSTYAYFAELYVYKKKPEQIGKEHHLSQGENIQFLNELASIGVIQNPNLKDLSASVNFLVKGTSHFIMNGPLSKKFNRQMVNEIFNQVQADLDEEKLKYSTLGLWITEEQQNAYFKELNELEKKYINISLQNRKNETKDARRVSAFMVLIPSWEPKFFNEIKKK